MVERSVRPLGELESWSRLRGGPERHGTWGDDKRKPEIVEEDGHRCVRVGENALGEPFRARAPVTARARGGSARGRR